MPRNEALIPFSHDHHHGLVVALRMKKGGPVSPHDTWSSDIELQRNELITFSNAELLPHFSLEEELLFPLLNDIDAIHPLLDTIVEEHQSMRKMLEAMSIAMIDDLPPLMKSFGILLESHIRKEERQLFPMIEELIGAGKLSLPKTEIEKRHDLYKPDPHCAV